MESRDKAEKIFMACRDVFVEIINGLIYNVAEILTVKDILPGPTESVYPGLEEKLSSQFQDCSMYDVRGGEPRALYTLENQSSVDSRMALRCIHVFDMHFLDRTIRERFKGDVRVVLDYLSDRDSMIRRRQKLKNPEEVMRILHALSGDERYLDTIPFIKEEGGRDVCELLDSMVNLGIQQGIQQGIQRGIQQGIQILIITCKELGITYDVAVAKIKEKFNLDDAEVQKDMKLYW